MLYFFVKPILYHGKKRVMLEVFKVKEIEDAQKICERGWIPLDVYYEGVPVYI